MKVQHVKQWITQGKCSVFKNWHEWAGITEEIFLDGIEWLCGDPKNDAPLDAGILIKRELACLPDGQLLKCYRSYEFDYFGINTVTIRVGEVKTAEWDADYDLAEKDRELFTTGERRRREFEIGTPLGRFPSINCMDRLDW